MDSESKFNKRIVLNMTTGNISIIYNVPKLLSICKHAIYTNVNKDTEITNKLFKEYINKISTFAEKTIVFNFQSFFKIFKFL
jgi:hypothetical protein